MMEKRRGVQAHILLTEALGLYLLSRLGFLQFQVTGTCQSTIEGCPGLSEEAKGSFAPGVAG